ncbi:MAG: UvrD-helicase domain-containing protein [Prevotellaceae bacterium]|jgi:DNA helicase-2/ATP-dependent DNA helicase PcrA|nr:UvrD-helicase domain-containing protein [Prevotellaceae bacterium]
MENFLNDLNDSQREAVKYIDGASLVVAGAGSGKTRVLTYKVAHLIQQGLPPYSILALTFTNKAAREMRNRIEQLVDYDSARRLWAGTFHSVFYRILRTESDFIGFTHAFTIYDSADSRSLLKTIIKEMKLDDKTYKANNVQSRISTAKNNLITPAMYAANTDILRSDSNAKMPLIRDIYQQYWSRCRAANAMDFDDLLLYTDILFRSNPQVLERYQDLFLFVLVDEYQDTNFAQHSIIKQIAAKHRRICVVGDDAQSIYSFRGANIDNILRFQDTYPESKLFKLEQNYRSTQNIVDAANSLIQKNKEQIRKTVFSEKERGALIRVLNAYSDRDEADKVAEEIRLLKRRYEYSDFAVLYRTNAQSRAFEESFRKSSIPYRIYGGLSFYQRKEIKDTLAYFRLAINQYDEEAFRRVINYPVRGIGDTTIGKLADAAQLHRVGIWDIAANPLAYQTPLNAGTCQKLKQFTDSIYYFSEEVRKKNAYEIAKEIIKRSGIMDDISSDQTPENLSRKENVEELLSAIHNFCFSENNTEDTSLTAFLTEISLLTDQDSEKDADTPRVTLMTIHAAKGLEFKNVFVVGLEEELFPSARCIMSERDLEEERRLFYVAITRCEENCFVSYAKMRFRNGQSNFCQPSRFLEDIDQEYLDLPLETKWNARSRNDNFDFFKTSSKPAFIKPPKLTKIEHTPVATHATNVDYDGLSINARIDHDRFGRGTVLSLEGEGDSRKMWVDFGDNQKRQLLLKFAKYKII